MTNTSTNTHFLLSLDFPDNDANGVNLSQDNS